MSAWCLCQCVIFTWVTWQRHNGQDSSSRIMRTVRSDGEALPPLCSLAIAVGSCWIMSDHPSGGFHSHGGTPKSSQIIHLNRIFHYKQSIFGYHHDLGTPKVFIKKICSVQLPGIGTSVDACDPTMPDPQCSARPGVTTCIHMMGRYGKFLDLIWFDASLKMVSTVW